MFCSLFRIKVDLFRDNAINAIVTESVMINLHLVILINGMHLFIISKITNLIDIDIWSTLQILDSQVEVYKHSWSRINGEVLINFEISGEGEGGSFLFFQ